MARKKTYSIKIGKKAKYTYWGRRGCSHSIYGGGYDFYVYGIKGLIAFEIWDGWGRYFINRIN